MDREAKIKNNKRIKNEIQNLLSLENYHFLLDLGLGLGLGLEQLSPVTLVALKALVGFLAAIKPPIDLR